MKATPSILAVCLSLCVFGLANASTDTAIAAAVKAQQAAAEVGYEWRDTGKMIKQAKALAAKGKSAEAIQLAKQAEEQGQDALKQYQSELKRYNQKK